MMNEGKNKEVLELSDAAKLKIVELMENRNKSEQAVRVAIRGSHTEFTFIDQDEQTKDDVVQDTGDFKIYFDSTSATGLKGAKMDFSDQRSPSGFSIEYPQAHAARQEKPARTKQWEDPIADKVQEVIDLHINPQISSHGGFVTLLEVKDDTAFIEMGGGCQGCQMAYLTLKQGIERVILESVPEIKKIVDTTDHADGNNPYYSPQ